MSMGFTGRIARSSAEHPWRTLSVWLTVLVIAGGLAGTVDQYVTIESRNYVTLESGIAEELDEEYRPNANGEVFPETAVIASEQFQYGDPAFDAAVFDTQATLAEIDGVHDVSFEPIVAPSQHAALVTFTTAQDQDISRAVLHALEELDTADVRVLPSGEGTFVVAFNDLAEEQLAKSEGFGVIVALIILILVFGALVAAAMPMVVALGSIMVATGALAVVGRAWELSDAAVTMTFMLGLALGIDYSLVAVQRFREELAKGHTVLDSITITGTTANRAIVLSGATVVVSLAGMVFIPTNTTVGIALGVGFVAIASVAAALTLLPAVLRLLGHRVNKGQIPTARPGQEPKGWARIARAVVARPAIAAAAGLAILLTLAAPIASIRLANAGPDAMPESFAIRQSNEVLISEFGYGQATTFVVIENADSAATAVRNLADVIEGDPAFEETNVDWRGDVAFIDTHDVYGSNDIRAEEAVERLRNDLIPDALEATGATALVGGQFPTQLDEIELFTSDSWKVVTFVLAVSFLILLVVFRSIVIAVKAIVLNLLGVAAAFGALVAVFQFGWGRFIGLPEVDAISPYMPVFIFALVFGLSMDYHVFLLSRIKERYDATRDNNRAIVEGLARTGPLITGAAIIMVAVFGGFAGADIPEMAQWGFGLAAAVLIDATIIRVLLVPAAMASLGRANWYVPRWLEWLPKTTIEAPSPEHEVDTNRGERESALV